MDKDYHNKEIIFGLIVLVITLIAPSIVIPSHADSINPGLFSPDSSPYGLSYGQWTAKWTQWLMGIPESNNPATDSTGKNCGQNQGGPVWFLAGTTGGSVERTCALPVDRAILFPIITSSCDYKTYPNINSYAGLVKCAQADNDRTTNLRVVVDGHELKDLVKYRVLSPLFTIDYPDKNIVGAPPGNTTAISDGFWVFLNPLPAGNHNIHFSGITPANPTTGTNNFVVDATYHLVVK